MGPTFRNYVEPIFLEVMVLVAHCLDLKCETHLLGNIMCGSPLEILIHVSTVRSRECQSFIRKSLRIQNFRIHKC